MPPTPNTDTPADDQVDAGLVIEVLRERISQLEMQLVLVEAKARQTARGSDQ